MEVRAILRLDEPEPVYRELVEGLSANLTPMIILCGLILSTGSYILSLVPDPFMLAATVTGVSASLIRIATILHHQRHHKAYRNASLRIVRRVEALHAVTAVAVGLSLGFYSAVIFGLPKVALDLVPVCIAYGYAAGVISRVSIRPFIAVATIMSAGIPSAAALALLDTEHRIVAAVYIIFLFAGLQSIAYVYETARRAVTLRLEMETLARRDPLTGLFNRFGLREAFETMLAREDAQGHRTITVHAFDLDGFKAVNDAFGHLAGDRLLALLAKRIQATVPAGTVAARIGGDEFVLLQPAGGDATTHLAQAIHHALTRPCDIDCGAPVSVGLSLGYATGRLTATALDELSQRADTQSYGVKRAGGGIRAHVARTEPTPPQPISDMAAIARPSPIAAKAELVPPSGLTEAI
jgi:diguanylate cyclase (GGDEF)-like protein